jgi:beta-lactamase regulating signal transducer with metallopeptidase domain
MNNIILLTLTGVSVFIINYRFYNKIHKLQSTNRDLQNKIEKLKYELSKKELTINSDTIVSPGPEAPRVSVCNDLILINREN